MGLLDTKMCDGRFEADVLVVRNPLQNNCDATHNMGDAIQFNTVIQSYVDRSWLCLWPFFLTTFELATTPTLA